MKTFALLLAAVVLCSCAGQQQLTPEEAKQYTDLAHSVVGNGIQDYKAVRPLIDHN